MLIPNSGNVNLPVNPGSVLQVEYLANNLLVNLPTIIPANSSVMTPSVITTNGFKVFGIGMTSSQNGVLSVQRYLDAAGTIPQDGDTSFNVDLIAGQPATLNVTDGKPFQSLEISVSNTSGTVATINPFILLLQAN